MKKKSMKKSNSGRAKILWRVGLAAVCLVLLLGAAVSVAMHSILTSGKVKTWVNTEPEKFRLEYASASGWFPWDVRVKDLELRSRDPNVEFYLKLENSRFAFSPFALLAHRFHVTRLTGSGLVYRLRVRPPRSGAPPAHFRALPPIPGFPERPPASESEAGDSNPKVPASASEHPAASTGARRQENNPFHIEIEGIRLERLTELWIDIWRWRGEAGTVTGSFRLWPGRSAQVGPASTEVSRGELSLGDNLIAREAAFSTSVTISEFDSEAVRGDAVWPYISGKARLDGRLTGIGFLNYFIHADPRLSGGEGTAHMAVDIVRGRGKGTVALVSRGVSARYKDASLRGDTDAALNIADWNLESGRIDVSGSRVELQHYSAQEPGPDSRDWWGRFDFPSADIVPGRPAVFGAAVKIHARDARPLFTLFQVGLPGWVRGLLAIDGIDASARVGLGSRYTDIQGLDAAGGGYRIRGRYLERRGGTDGAFLVEKGILTVGLEIRGDASKLKLVGARSWFEQNAAPPRKDAPAPVRK